LDIALISPPWPLFNRPSVQLGALKAFLKTREPEIEVRAFHPYLRLAAEIGFEDYLIISQSSWAAESVFAALLFPKHNGPEKLFYKALGNRFGRERSRLDFNQITTVAANIIDHFIQDQVFAELRLAGLSLCLNQMTAGLYIAKKLKERIPETIIVLGGASCSGPIGPSILAAFPFVDYTVTGEGEGPLLDLWHFLSGRSERIKSRAISGGAKKSKSLEAKEQIGDVNKLPTPDYDDYFRELGQLGAKAAGISPLLPLEASRGCWWSRCNFCNLNLQWKGYRAKTATKVASEVKSLSSRYGVLDFAFMDNCLPAKQAPEIFSLIHRQKRDYSFFAELRVGHCRKDLAVMARGGLSDVQVGIEALSTSLLRRLGKGSSAIENLAIMRHCTELDIRLQANLILHFPGSSDEEVRQTLVNLDFVWPFAPLKTVSFWLGAESPVYREPEKFNIVAVKRHPYYSHLFPDNVASKLVPLILGYRGDRQKQYKLWKKVEQKVASINREKAELAHRGKLLTYRDGEHFLTIRQILPGGHTLKHRLTGSSRNLYLACQEPVTLDRLEALVQGRQRGEVEAFVNSLCQKRLMFREGDRVLALAVREKMMFLAEQNI